MSFVIFIFATKETKDAKIMKVDREPWSAFVLKGEPMNAEDDLAARVGACLAGIEGVSEKTMFGGVGFMLHGNLIAGASKRGLLLRVGKDRHAAALAEPGMKAMEMRGRVMEGYVYADPPPASDAALKALIDRALEHVRTLPPKAAQAKGKSARAKRK